MLIDTMYGELTKGRSMIQTIKTSTGGLNPTTNFGINFQNLNIFIHQNEKLASLTIVLVKNQLILRNDVRRVNATRISLIIH